jgi:hypothetical protein
MNAEPTRLEWGLTLKRMTVGCLNGGFQVGLISRLRRDPDSA